MDWMKAIVLLLAAVIFTGLLILALGCGASQERPACAPGKLAEIEARYIAEVLTVCNGQHFDTCTERLKVDKKYEAERQEWVQCK
jgi:hypothetical protein